VFKRGGPPVGADSHRNTGRFLPELAEGWGKAFVDFEAGVEEKRDRPWSVERPRTWMFHKIEGFEEEETPWSGLDLLIMQPDKHPEEIPDGPGNESNKLYKPLELRPRKTSKKS